VSVIVPVHNGAEDLARCLDAVNLSDWHSFECIVVDDASTDPRIAEIAGSVGARLERLEQRRGPALARNAGAMKARGDILFFTDSDVVLHSDALGKAVAALESDPGVGAVFGSYDDSPAHDSLLSRYRNLYHHWNHQCGNEEASTFWTGCGAIRREAFLELGGFSPDYARPSIEDIELGYRLRDAGYRVRLLTAMQCTHLKRWKFWDMLRTDIFRRGVPWVALLRRHRSAPADLNLNWRAKLATVAAALFAVSALLAPLSGHARALLPTLTLFLAAAGCSRLVWNSDTGNSGKGWKSFFALSIAIVLPLMGYAWAPDPWAMLPLLFVAVIVWAQFDFYRLLSLQGGVAFAIAVVPLQVLFFMGCALAVPLGVLSYHRHR
jgi:GT2 family glycosyltransferase